MTVPPPKGLPARQALRISGLLGLAALLLLPAAARAYDPKRLIEARFDPRLRFRTIETPHFRIHFAVGLEASAAHLAALAEPTHAAVTRTLGWVPRAKTDVVLGYDSDRTNAFTVTYPTTQIYVSSAPPTLSQAIFHHGDWMRWILAHEYTHVVHQDRVAGLSRVLRPLLGVFARPNMVQPAWLKEGLGVVMESALDSSGRSGSSTYRMMFRVADRAGRLGHRDFGSLESASYQHGERWPWVLRSYLWGSALVAGMERISPGVLPRIAEAGARGVPGALGPAFRRAGLPPPAEVQERTVGFVRLQAREEMATLRARPETEVTRLTWDGYDKFGLSIDPSGAELLFTRQRPEVDNMAVLVTLDESGAAVSRRELFLHQSGYQKSYSRSGRYVAFDDVDSFERNYLWSDLFLFDRETDTAVLRSRGLRGRDPDIHPDGVTLAFVRTVLDRNQVVLCDSGFGNVLTVYAPEGRRRLAQPRWSPDGRQLAFLEHREETGGERILVWEADKGVRALTDGGSQDRDPVWTPNGDHILFSSDRNGTFQIYALAVATGEIRQVTHRYGGAFWPVPDPRGRFLFFIDYGAKGYDVVRMPWQPQEWFDPATAPSLGPAGKVLAGPVVAAVPDFDTSPRDYSTWRYLTPRFLRPSFALRRGGVQLGAATGGIDPLFRHHYGITARWDTASGRPVGRLLYWNGATSLPWALEVDRDVFEVERGQDRLDQATATLRTYVPLSRHGRARELQLSALFQRYARGGVTQELAGGMVRAQRDTRVLQPNDLVPESGTLAMADASHLLRRGSTPVTLLRAGMDAPFRLPGLGAHSVLTVSTRAAWARARREPEYLLYAGGEASFPFSAPSAYVLGGHEPNALAADRLVLSSVRLTRPVARVERGLPTLPLYVDRLSLGLRAEAGYFERAETTVRPWSLGAEAVADTSISTLWPIRWTAGLHRGGGAAGAGWRFVLTASAGR